MSRRPVPGKLGAPRPERIVARERLFGALDAGAVRPMIWIAGPPGSGKSSLAASWLAARKRSAAWLRLDRADSDAASFFHFVSQAAAVARPRRRFRLPEPASEDRRELDGFARRYFRQLSSRLGAGWTLVLDNVESLAADSPVCRLLRVAIEEMPAGACIVAISRELPAPALARAMATQQIALIEAAALRFTLSETASLLATHRRSHVAGHLHAATDGWVAGMILMLEAGVGVGGGSGPGAGAGAPSTLDAGSAPSSSEMASRSGSGVGATSRDRVFDYFANEVFGRMPVRQRRSLMRLAVVPAVASRRAASLSGDPDAADVLAALHRRNLFVDRRGSADPVYSFHALFRDFLLSRAQREVDGPIIDRWRVEAGALLAEDGQVDDAIELLVEAKAWDEAVTLLHRHAPVCLEQGRTSTLRGWLDALPRAMRDRPMSTYWAGCCELDADPAGAQRDFVAAFDGFTAAGDQVGRLLAAAGAAESIVLLGADQTPLDRWLTVFERLAPRYFEIQDPATELRVLPGMLAAFVARRAQHRLTGVLSDRAERLLDQEPAATQRILFGAVSNCFIDAGLHERVGRIVARLQRWRSVPHIPPGSALRWLQVEIFWATLTGRIEGLVLRAEEVLELSRLPSLRAMRPLALLSAAQAYWVVGDIPAAARMIEEARGLVQPSRLYERGVLEFLDGVVALGRGDAAVGVERLGEAVALARAAGCYGRERVALFALCLTSTEAGELAAAEEALRAAKGHPSYGVSHFHQWVIAIIEANLASRSSDDARCLAALRRGCAIARSHGYTYAPGVFATGIMPRMCAIALRHGIDTAFVRRLIRERGLAAPPDAPTCWPWPVRIHALGRFVVERDDAELPTTRKEQRKPLDMLAIVIAQGSRGVNAKRVAHQLWPDADGVAAQNSFDNTLHRLRRMLGSERSVVLRDGGLSIDASYCWIDARARRSIRRRRARAGRGPRRRPCPARRRACAGGVGRDRDRRRRRRERSATRPCGEADPLALSRPLRRRRRSPRTGARRARATSRTFPQDADRGRGARRCAGPARTGGARVPRNSRARSARRGRQPPADPLLPRAGLARRGVGRVPALSGQPLDHPRRGARSADRTTGGTAARARRIGESLRHR